MARPGSSSPRICLAALACLLAVAACLPGAAAAACGDAATCDVSYILKKYPDSKSTDEFIPTCVTAPAILKMDPVCAPFASKDASMQVCN